MDRQKTISRYCPFKEPRNRSQGIDSANLHSLAGRYDNPIPTRFLSPIYFSGIQAQTSIDVFLCGNV